MLYIPDVKPMEWVSVEDMLPPDAEDVLMYVANYYRFDGYGQNSVFGAVIPGFYSDDENGFYEWGAVYMECDATNEGAKPIVTHWMPFPGGPSMCKEHITEAMNRISHNAAARKESSDSDG